MSYSCESRVIERIAILMLFLASAPVAAQWLTLSTPNIPRTADGEPDLSAPAPRTADGRPDFSGLWRPGGTRGDLPESDKYQAWVVALKQDRNRRFNSDNPRNLCLPEGPGYHTENTEVAVRRIVQSPNVIAFLYADLKYRQIFMDGRELEAEPLPTWMGYSVGRWEDDTLVVESNGYNDKTWLHRLGVGHSERLRMTERYTRGEFGTIQLEISYDDPGAFREPLKVTSQLRYIADDEMLEVVCNEASQGTSHYTGDWDDVEADLVELDPEILAKYVGKYRGLYVDATITVDVTLEDGKLFLSRRGTKAELIPQGDTSFIRGGWAYVFTVDEAGTATAISEVHVSGGWIFDRVP
jgi:hypothetical protein